MKRILPICLVLSSCTSFRSNDGRMFEDDVRKESDNANYMANNTNNYYLPTDNPEGNPD